MRTATFRWLKRPRSGRVHHSGIGLVTPAQRHHGMDKVVYEKRQRVIAAFYEQHPERFVRGMPKPPELPGKVWINKPGQALKVA